MENIIKASELITAIRTIAEAISLEPRYLLKGLPEVRDLVNQILEKADIEDEFQLDYECQWFEDIDGNEYRIEHSGAFGSSSSVWWLSSIQKDSPVREKGAAVRRSGTVVSMLARRMMIKD